MRYTYVIECDGHYYPATHGTLADTLTDATVKRRVRKAGHSTIALTNITRTARMRA